MKRFILAFALLAGSAGVASAQTSTASKPGTEMTAAEQDRLQFVSYMNELDASLGRNNPALAQQVMNKLQAYMQTHTAATNKQALSVSDAASKAELQSRASQQSAILVSVRALSSNLVQNRGEINIKLKEYLKNF